MFAEAPQKLDDTEHIINPHLSDSASKHPSVLTKSQWRNPHFPLIQNAEKLLSILESSHTLRPTLSPTGD